ncbi:GNAT family N-acetyltransferase, partial [Klebsiella pneumoniae]
MPIPILYTERLLLKPLSSDDSSQIQKLYPRWEIVR